MSQVISSKLVDPYAEALLNLADSNGSVDIVTADVKEILDLLGATPDLKDYLANPMVSSKSKKELLEKTICDQLSKYTNKFLLVLVDRKRIQLLEPIANRYLDLVYKLAEIKIVEVSSAIKLSETQESDLAAKITKMSGAKEIKLVTTLDTQLLGGVLIKIGSQEIDLSLKGQLRDVASLLQTSAV
jgi:F-type H+-transporting ATPase subunit delta